MKRERSILLLAVLLISAAAGILNGEGKISGLAFGDYYYALAHHDEAVEGRNGFWLRRVYFTYDGKLSEKYAMRFRLEANSPGDFKTATNLVPFIKDAYLAVRLGRQTLALGLVATDLYSTVEDFWGYRPMEKTPIDLFKFGNSREMGLYLKGPLDRRGRLSYSLTAGNGDGLKSEVNRGKAVHGRLSFQPNRSLLFELFANRTDTGPGTSIAIVHAFAGVKGSRGRAGFNFGWRHDDQGQSESDLKFMSLFAVGKINGKLEIVGRYDRLLDPFSGASKIDYIPMADNARANVVLAGLGWQLSEGIQVIPSVKYVFYDSPGAGEKPDADLYAYLTLYFKF